MDYALLLPQSLRSTSCRSGNEWAWRLESIPLVIEESEKLGLLNVGGQLQFLMPEGICECYWIEVDSLRAEPAGLRWSDRVVFAATAARNHFDGICRHFDFVEEGRKAFPAQFEVYEAAGGDVRDRMWFVWYLDGQRS